MNRPVLGPPTPSARAASAPCPRHSRGQARWGQRPSRQPNALQMPELARTDRWPRRGARRPCSFFLSEKPCLAQRPQSLPRTHNLPEPFPSTSRQCSPGLQPRFQARTCSAGQQLSSLWGLSLPSRPGANRARRREGITGDVRGDSVHLVTILSFHPHGRLRPALPISAVASWAQSPRWGCTVRAWTCRSELRVPDARWLKESGRSP